MGKGGRETGKRFGRLAAAVGGTRGGEELGFASTAG